MTESQKRTIKINKLLREIERKKKEITISLIGLYVTYEFNPDGILKKGVFIGDTKKKINKKFTHRDIYQQENGEKILEEHIDFLNTIIFHKPKSITKNQWKGVGILAIIIFLLVYSNTQSTIKENRENRYKSVSTSKLSEIVMNSPWDSSVSQVEDYLKGNLKDPDSYQAIEWSSVNKKDNGNFIVRHKYRAKNSFGGMVISNAIFTLDSRGNVIGHGKLN